jgi:glycosyltransferase involved in cell wall biosynthesis
MIDEFYGRIDVLIHPSIAEGSSNVIMEALALGIPVITTDEAGYHGERLTDGMNALIRPRNVEAIAGAASLLKDDERLRRQIGSGARLFALKHHEIRKVAKKYKRIIRAVLSAGNALSEGNDLVTMDNPPTRSEASRGR